MSDVVDVGESRLEVGSQSSSKLGVKVELAGDPDDWVPAPSSNKY